MVRSQVLSWEPDGYSDADPEEPMVMIRFLSSDSGGTGRCQNFSIEEKRETD
jgi:hypothetical protein